MSVILPPDACVGAYTILRVVGVGGMGVVYEAWDSRLERRVALKTIHPHLVAGADVAQRFLREARNMARVEHPNVVRVYRVDECDGQFILEMEFIDGTPLSVLLQSKRFTLSQGVHLLRQILEGLAACHEKGLVHCDLKPGNLIVGSNQRVWLTDFGVARALSENSAPDSSPEDALGRLLWGTPRYCPPEAWWGGPVTPAWDIYSAGVIAFEIFTGAPPLDSSDLSASRSVPPRLSELRPEASGAFSELLDELLSREISGRPSSAREALARLRTVPECRQSSEDTQPLETSAKTACDAETVAPRKTLFRWRRWAAGGAVLALAMLAALWFRHGPMPVSSEGGALGKAASEAGPEHLLLGFDLVFFTDDDPRYGRELWCTNGCPGGTRLVADLVPGPQSSNPSRFLKRSDGNYVFRATTPETGSELWFLAQTGGGNVEVRLIKDIIPGAMGSDPLPVAAYENQIVFYATTLNEGRELWCTNGFEAQTALVLDAFPGRQGSQPAGPSLCPVEAGLYLLGLTDFRRGMLLEYYDYSGNTLREVADVSEGTGGMVFLDGRLLFANQDEQHGMELWAYEPTAQALSLVADIRPGPHSSGPGYFFVWKDRVYFQARTDEHGLELWSSNGTPEGTRLVMDINPGPADSDPSAFTDSGENLVFRATDSTAGREPWITDGSLERTRRLADVWPGPQGSEPYNLVLGTGWFLFSANDGVHGEELWGMRLSDGGGPPQLIQDLFPGPTGSEPHELVWIDPNRGIFVAILPSLGPHLVALKFSKDLASLEIL